MTETITKDALPTSFGAFNPVGHLMVGLPNASHAKSFAAALREAGWDDDALVPFTPSESVAEFEALTEDAGAVAGFGYEITLMRKYLALSREGCQWLLVRVDDSEEATQVADVARVHGATLAVHYRMLIIEELI